MPDEQHYERATLEVADKRLAPGVWGRAFADALGDERKALALYVRYRAEQLEAEDHRRREFDAREAADERSEAIARWVVYGLACGAVGYLLYCAAPNPLR